MTEEEKFATMRVEAERILARDFGGSTKAIAENCLSLLDEVERLQRGLEEIANADTPDIVLASELREIARKILHWEKTRPDSQGRMHAADCMFEETAKFPVCTCGTWPRRHLNTSP